MSTSGYNAIEAKLWGGPKHGEHISVPAGMNIIRVVGGSATPGGILLSRQGQYSQVAGPGNQHNFEWDGWDPR